ncbi:hypothetical protein PV646_02975 [Streptomyces sp. ID05-26A]|nr:hypothetical protein [Streptomyces sp. ID05-26A]
MIAKAPAKGKYGKDTYGLLRYLFGPGKSNEHTNPHLIASWDPEWLAGGVFAERRRGWLARLAREIDAPMTGHAVQLDGGHVYHVALSLPRQDGQLGDARWRALVEEAVDRVGFGPTDDGRAGCRWVAVHHGPSKDGNDHVHLAVNLVRGDGTIADTYRDWPRWRQWCLDVENRLGLTRTSPADKTAAIRPTRAETEKAARNHRPGTSRDFLRRAVRAAAAEAASATEFIQLLQRELLVTVEARWDHHGSLTGYRVAASGDWSTTSPDGRVWYGGGSLAHDLSAPKLTNRWAATSAAAGPDDELAGARRDANDLLARATQATENARSHLAALLDASDTSTGGGGDGITHAAADMLIAVATTIDRPTPGALTEAAAAYEWAATAPHRVQPVQWSQAAVELRTAARALLKAGILSKRASTSVAAVALLVALAGLLAQTAAWRQQAGQTRQAAAAQRAADLVNIDGGTWEHNSVRAPRHATGTPTPNTTPGLQPDQRRTTRQRPPRRGHDPLPDAYRGRAR